MLYHDILNKVLKKSYFLNWKYQNLALSIVVTGKGVKANNKNTLPPTIDPHLWDSHLTIATSVLGYYPKQASLQKFLYYKYYSYEDEIFQVVGQWQRNNKIESSEIFRKLRRY